jgi:hypothetical protein
MAPNAQNVPIKRSTGAQICTRFRADYRLNCRIALLPPPIEKFIEPAAGEALSRLAITVQADLIERRKPAERMFISVAKVSDQVGAHRIFLC